MELKYVGGVFGGNIKPTPFICLTLKMLQIQPEKDIIVEFIKNEDFKLVFSLCTWSFSRCISFCIELCFVLQVCSFAWSIVYAPDWHFSGLLQVFRAIIQ